MYRHIRVFCVLALTQILGWGAVGLLPVLAARIAADLGVDLAPVFLGTSVMFVAMGLCAPVAGRGFRRFGARRVMACGAVGIGAGLGIMGLARGMVVFLLSWGVIGVAGAAFLTTAAYAWLAGYAGRDAGTGARNLIGLLMLVTALAGTVFWPVTALLDLHLGWRGTAFAYAGAMVVLAAPLVAFGLHDTGAGAGGTAATGTRPDRRIFGLIVLAVTLNSFVTFGIDSIGIELFRALGAETAMAVAIASALGVFKLGGRLVDLAGGRRWDGLSTALVSGALIPAGVLAVVLAGPGQGGPGWAGLGGYFCLFGIGSGAFAVARATMPLVFFAPRDYASAMAVIALPMNLINALAPPALAALLVATGPRFVLGLLAAISLGALGALWCLSRMRRAQVADGGGVIS